MEKIENKEGKAFIEMQNLLHGFHNPCVMDIKVGVRTFLEEEAEGEPRRDLYSKMIEISPHEPSIEENQSKAITKIRYMSWRDSFSSKPFGFRIQSIHVNYLQGLIIS